MGILVWTPKHGISEITKANYIWYMLKLPNSLNVGKVIFTRIYCKKSWVFFTPKNWAKFLGILVWTPKHGISEITKANYIWYMLKLPNSLNVGKVIFTRIYTSNILELISQSNLYNYPISPKKVSESILK